MNWKICRRARREELLKELAGAPINIRDYLREAMGQLFGGGRFMDPLPGYVPADVINQLRLPNSDRAVEGDDQAVRVERCASEWIFTSLPRMISPRCFFG
jgi:hypothetical protein